MIRKKLRHRENLSMAEAFDGLKADYDAMKITRFTKTLTGVSASGSGADYHYRNEHRYLRMMERARDFDRNDMVTGQGVTRLVDNVLKSGMKLDPTSGNPKFDVAAAAKWKTWSETKELCDVTGQKDLLEIAALTLRAVIFDGDILTTLLKSGQLQSIEAHRLRTPNKTKKNVVLGILLDELRKPLEYWVTRDDIGTTQRNILIKEIKPIPAWDKNGKPVVLHHMIPKRLNQTRGVTTIAPIFDVVGMHDDIEFAKLVQQQIASCYVTFRELAPDSQIPTIDPTGETTTETRDDGSTRTVEGISPGMEITGAPGEKLTGFSPNIPNAEFFQHAMLILTFIAVNMGIPVAVLLLDPSNTNFSGWRGAMDQARIGFQRLQRLMVKSFYKPIYEWKIRNWMVEDSEFRALAEAAKTDPFGHAWQLPIWPYIEPAKDAKADETITDNRLNSHRGVLSVRGLDIEKVQDEIVADMMRLVRLAKTGAATINEEFPDDGDPVKWRELAIMDSSASTVQPIEVELERNED